MWNYVTCQELFLIYSVSFFIHSFNWSLRTHIAYVRHCVQSPSSWMYTLFQYQLSESKPQQGGIASDLGFVSLVLTIIIEKTKIYLGLPKGIVSAPIGASPVFKILYVLCFSL